MKRHRFREKIQDLDELIMNQVDVMPENSRRQINPYDYQTDSGQPVDKGAFGPYSG